MSTATQPSKAERLSIILILIGITLTAFGTVRSGAIVLAVGGGAFSYLKYTRVGTKRRIELFLPLATACALLVVAITLPHAR